MILPPPAPVRRLRHLPRSASVPCKCGNKTPPCRIYENCPPTRYPDLSSGPRTKLDVGPAFFLPISSIDFVQRRRTQRQQGPSVSSRCVISSPICMGHKSSERLPQQHNQSPIPNPCPNAHQCPSIHWPCACAGPIVSGEAR